MSYHLIPFQPPISAALLFYDDQLLFRSWQDGVITNKFISAATAREGFSLIPNDSGWLAPEILRVGTHQSKPFAIMHVAARTYTIWCDGKQLRVPLPSAIFAMFGDNCYLFAKKEDSFAPTQTLFHFPLPNINSNGLICFGTYDKPASVTDTFNLFHQSSFNHHHVNEKSRKFPTDVRRLLSQLDGKKKFPLTDLISLDKTADEIFARYLAR